MPWGDPRRPRMSHVTFTIGGGREPSLRREAIVTALLDVCMLTTYGVMDFQRARMGGLTALDFGTHLLVVLSLACGQLQLWWRIYVRLRRGEDVAAWSHSTRVRRVWEIMSAVVLWSFALLAAAQLARILQTGQPDWLSIGAVAVTLWLFRSLALVQVVGLPGEGASTTANSGSSRADAPEPDGA